mgnify:CR=1 FL=1
MILAAVERTCSELFRLPGQPERMKWVRMPRRATIASHRKVEKIFVFLKNSDTFLNSRLKLLFLLLYSNPVPKVSIKGL